MSKKELKVKRESFNPFWSYCFRISSIIFITSIASYLVLWILVLLLNMTSRVLNIVATVLMTIVMVSCIITVIMVVVKGEIEEFYKKKNRIKKRG